MLEWVQSRSSHFVPRIGGQLLCSSIDPIAESRKWVEKNVDRAERYDALIVLGLAGGFHVNQLALLFPDVEITVIETNSNLERELLSRRGPLPANVTLLSDMTVNEVRENVYIRSVVRSLFRVLKYPTSYRMAKEYYDQVEALLVGHCIDSLKYQLDARKDQKAFFEAIDFFDDPSQTELTIVDIQKAIRRKARPVDRTGMIWMALGELVK